MSDIVVSGLGFAYRDRLVLADIDLVIEPGARLAILGGNGSGKTTLAKWLAGWLPDGGRHSGTVACDDRPWPQWTPAERAATVQLVGQIPQRHLSGRAFTVREEVAFGPENLNLPLAEIRARTERAMGECRIEHLADRDPFTLSGGEQQRLVIAAALALEPRFLILDEPLTNLDPDARGHILSLLSSLPPDRAVVLFDTSPDTALSVANQFQFMSEGQILARGNARQVLLHQETIRALGLPSVPRACRELALFDDLPDSDMPLSVDEARQRSAGGQDACRP